MIKINLLSEGKRPTAVRKAKPAQLLEGKNLAVWLLAAGALIGLLALGLWWAALRGKIQEKDTQVAEAQAKVDEMASVIKEVEDYKSKKTELERKISVINDLKLNQRGPVRVMDDVSRALPELLWLDKMSMSNSSIEIEGRAFNTNAVANFIENLDKVAEFEEPTVRNIQEQTGGVYKFVINFSYSFAPLATGATPADAAGAAPASPAAPAPPPPAAG
jgi:type IV pilus assembly protein PilN